MSLANKICCQTFFASLSEKLCIRAVLLCISCISKPGEMLVFFVCLFSSLSDQVCFLYFIFQSQSSFLCEAILKVYEEGFVKPLTTSSNK